MKVLGISGSLRNARHGRGNSLLIDEINNIACEMDLLTFLENQTKIRANEFLEAGRQEGLPFDEIFKNLNKARGLTGLSNSEASITAALWGATQEGAEISHAGLSKYFPMNGTKVSLDELKNIILEADALLVSGPVYFGDRGSLVQEFIEFISSDLELRNHLKGRIYAGVSVGAKRNGGQETQLIYQLIDMSNINMLSVGNSAETSSQYGGTVVAGDVGTAWKDKEGLITAIGTGRRLAKIALSKVSAKKYSLSDPVKIGIWLTQDTESQKGLKYISHLIDSLRGSNVEFKLIDITKEEVYRCIACDLCPTHHAPREEYACIIKSKNDFFVKEHADLLDVDAILLASYSPIDKINVNSVYQKFIERTRYIRRGHFMLSDRLVAPLVISELGANQNMHIRMLTSLIRHHTILHHPIIAIEQNNKILNHEAVHEQLSSFLSCAIETTIARLTQDILKLETKYTAVGYSISKERNEDDHRSGKLSLIFNSKENDFLNEQKQRLLELEE